MDINESIFSFVRDDYQRDNFDSFLRKVSFSYSIPSIHVAGSSGKTIISYILNNIYLSANYKVGLFTSSSKRDIRENIKINGESVSLDKVNKLFNDNQKLFKKFDLSHFEIITFIALSIFKEENVDIAVIEVGMGGEVDATNIFTPLVSIISNVSMEHTEYLGVSLSEIALHKAGIIKEKVSTVIGEIEGDALDTIVDIARRKDSKITRIGKYHNLRYNNEGISFEYKTHENLRINNLSKTNVNNACLAIDVIDLLNERFPVSDESIRNGLLKRLPKGRFEYIPGNVSLILDSAHNPDAIRKLREDVDMIANKETFVIFASFNDKNITLMLPEIALLGKTYILTFDHPRARKEEDYFLYLDEYEFKEDYHLLIKDIVNNHPNCLIVITGSTYFVERIEEEIANGAITLQSEQVND